MAAEKEINGIYKDIYRHMLLKYENIKSKNPGKHPDAEELLEELREFCIDVTGVNDFKPVPKD